MNIEDKIQKLLRLAGQQDSAEEAAVAFGQAQRLATLHGLDLDDLMTREAEDNEAPTPREVESITRREVVQWNRVVVWKLRLVGALARANQCKHYYHSGRCGGVIVYGQPSDINTIVYMFAAIVPQIESLTREALAAYWGDEPRVYGRSFRLGVVDAIRRKLKDATDVLAETRAEVDQARLTAGDDVTSLARSTHALARVCAAEEHVQRVEAAIETWAEDNLNLTTGQKFKGAGDSSGYYDGRRAGATVVVSNKSAKALT